ncbi:lysoplasmalogenase [Pedobacter sp. HMWF019]|uniref:lysoplasmalogenase n=1 Tax=Pedobacter sp. HMWF019 TaxID=2056856 RepID=UPI000D373A15|nr:lysoplasmalogenase [Pedobacter sp. HMWF019]PTS91527.1 lysoplasmalogenase [Pedobacter sp. HMWF019]
MGVFKKYRVFSILYLFIFILELIAEFQQLNTLRLIVKPCIVLSLAIFFCLQTKLRGRFHKRLFIGLLFALAGDVLLLFTDANPNYFMYGLLSFLLAHLFYTRAFYLDFRSAQELDKKNARIAIAACSISSIAFYLFLRPHLGALKLPVMIYTFVISMMLMMSVFRNLRVNKESFILVFAGAILFILSDGLLAYNKFVSSFSFAGVCVMATYMLAQYLIVIGAAERTLLSQEP